MIDESERTFKQNEKRRVKWKEIWKWNNEKNKKQNGGQKIEYNMYEEKMNREGRMQSKNE
jgi:hypothetical protein